jgi:hypothetical protein
MTKKHRPKNKENYNVQGHDDYHTTGTSTTRKNRPLFSDVRKGTKVYSQSLSERPISTLRPDPSAMSAPARTCRYQRCSQMLRIHYSFIKSTSHGRSFRDL